VRGLVLIAAALLAACGAPDSESAPGSDSTAKPAAVAVGAPAPNYGSQTLAGDPISLADLRGKVVLLNVWATWCHPCREEIPQLEALHAKHADAGLEVVGVSIDGGGSEAAIRTFMRDFDMTYSVWLDPEERVSARFLTIGVPETFLIDRGGVIRWRHIGPIEPNDASLAEALESALKG
jgi:cytochrome c biogenesis protein CcmG, thiol:disulfide interchange protein DsbE